jgi:hypothetical protein
MIAIASVCAADHEINPKFVRYIQRGNATEPPTILGISEWTNGLVISTSNPSANPARVLEMVDTSTGRVRVSALNFGREFRNMRVTVDGEIFGEDFETGATSGRSFVASVYGGRFYPCDDPAAEGNLLHGYDVMQSGSERFVIVSGSVQDAGAKSATTMFRNGIREWQVEGHAGDVQLDRNRNVYIASRQRLSKLSRRGVSIWNVFFPEWLDGAKVELVPDDSPLANPRVPDVLVFGQSGAARRVYRYDANGFLERVYTLSGDIESARRLRNGEVLFQVSDSTVSIIDAAGQLRPQLQNTAFSVNALGNVVYLVESDLPNISMFRIESLGPTFEVRTGGRIIDYIAFDRYNNAGIITRLPQGGSLWTAYITAPNLHFVEFNESNLRPGGSVSAVVGLRFGSPTKAPARVRIEYNAFLTGPDVVEVPSGQLFAEFRVFARPGITMPVTGVMRGSYGGQSMRYTVPIRP